jgi:AraC-like DNA-binding protein
MSTNSLPTIVASRTLNGNVRLKPRSRFSGRHDALADRAPEIHDPSVTGAQQRIVTAYIEELAQLVRLSPYHFCRAFKQSLGIPPHRFHTLRRIERAKALLAKPGSSVTDVGLSVGFSQTSSLSAAFRKATGSTPTAYHRSLC